MNLFLFLVVAFGNGSIEEHIRARSSIILDELDAPRPFLDKQTYMSCVYRQALNLGANDRDLMRLHQIAHTETRENPRLCVPGGCGPFQHEVHTLVPKSLRNVAFAHALVRFLLTNKPGFAARTTLELLHKCEKLSGEHWRCCYGGAYRPLCRIKWDKTYNPDFMKEKEDET